MVTVLSCGRLSFPIYRFNRTRRRWRYK